MYSKKETLINILTELENYWQLASWFKKLVILSEDKDMINSLYDIILENIKLAQNQTNNQNIIKIEKKLKQIKNEELKNNENYDNIINQI